MDTNKLQRIICAGLLGSALALNGVASAAVVTNRVPLLGYADHNITVYRAPGGMQAAVVAAEAALIQITQVRADGWAYGTYPMSNGRRAGGWFRMSDVQSNVNYSNANGKIVMQQTVYRTPSMSGSNGVVVAGENVLVIAEQDGFSQIIYKQKNSANWRIGWVLSSAIQKEQVDVPMNRSQNTASAQKTTPITSNVKVSSKQTANDSVQKVQPTVQKTTMQTTSASTSVKSAVQKSTKLSTMAKTNTATKTVSTTAGKQNIQLTNNRNAGLQLGKARNQIINRYGQALRQSHIFNNAELTNRKGIALNAGASFVVLEESGVAYKITYSAQNQLQEGWVNRNDISLLNVLYKIWQGTMNQRAQAFYNIELTQRSNQIEFAEKGDKVTILNEKGNAYFISYPLTNGSYKARWVVQNTVSGTNPNRIVVPVTRQNTVLKGDMNQDGKVDQVDLEILTRVRVGKEPLTDYYRKAGDMNGDGKIDIIDMANLSDAITKGAKAGMDAALKFKPEIAKRHVDVYDDAGKLLNGRYIDRGESYTVIEERGNRLKVNYKSAKGEDRQGWVPSSIREEIKSDYGTFPPEKWVETCKGKEVTVDIFNGVPAIYPAEIGNYNSSKYNHSYNCAAYVKKYYKAIYGFEPYNLVPNGTPKNSRNEKAFTKITDGTVKAGDIIGMSSSFASVNGHWAIAKGVEGNQIVLIEQNKRASNSTTAPVNRRMPISSVNIYRWIN